jgi:hypothetical protein
VSLSQCDQRRAALQHQWSQALWARIERLSLDPTISDAGELARRAWADCTVAFPMLRRLLDEGQGVARGA